jgi:hypothetical protein
MRHTRDEVIERAVNEFKLLDDLVSGLSIKDWERPLARPETRAPWTVKDALVHITYWKADVARGARKERRPADVRGLETNAHNHVIFERWRNRTPAEVLAWHRSVQAEVLDALRAAPDDYVSGRGRHVLVGHSREHRSKDIERALRSGHG